MGFDPFTKDSSCKELAPWCQTIIENNLGKGKSMESQRIKLKEKAKEKARNMTFSHLVKGSHSPMHSASSRLLHYFLSLFFVFSNLYDVS